MSSEDVARSAFGIFRKRVSNPNERDVQSSKNEVVAEAEGKGKGKGATGLWKDWTVSTVLES
jgi:hypothetical protein